MNENMKKNNERAILLANGYYLSTMINPLYGQTKDAIKTYRVWRKNGLFMGYVGKEYEIIENCI